MYGATTKGELNGYTYVDLTPLVYLKLLGIERLSIVRIVVDVTVLR